MTQIQSVKKITLAITGASGAQYGLRLLECLLAQGCHIDLMISRAAQVVINTETPYQIPNEFDAQVNWLKQNFLHSNTTNNNTKNISTKGSVTLYSREDWFCPAASGSSAARQMVVCPASGGTLSAIAHGSSNNLIERAGDVALKERRQLILVPREAPYSQVHLENMLKLTQMGAIVIPASPGFYQNPQSIEDLIDFVVARILDQLGLEQKLLPLWGET